MTWRGWRAAKLGKNNNMNRMWSGKIVLPNLFKVSPLKVLNHKLFKQRSYLQTLALLLQLPSCFQSHFNRLQTNKRVIRREWRGLSLQLHNSAPYFDNKQSLFWPFEPRTTLSHLSHRRNRVYLSCVWLWKYLLCDDFMDVSIMLYMRTIFLTFSQGMLLL